MPIYEYNCEHCNYKFDLLVATGNTRVKCPLCQGKVKKLMSTFSVGGSHDFTGGIPAAGLRCLGESRAGVPFDGGVAPGTCIEIYTGAELPASCCQGPGSQLYFQACISPGSILLLAQKAGELVG